MAFTKLEKNDAFQTGTCEAIWVVLRGISQEGRKPTWVWENCEICLNSSGTKKIFVIKTIIISIE